MSCRDLSEEKCWNPKDFQEDILKFHSFYQEFRLKFSAFSKYLSGDALENQLNSKIFGGISMVKHMYEIHLLQSRVETKEGGQIPELELGWFQY